MPMDEIQKAKAEPPGFRPASSLLIQLFGVADEESLELVFFTYLPCFFFVVVVDE